NLDRYLSGLAISKFNPQDIREWAIIIISVIIGILSHYFWDAITHAQGEIALLLPFLNNSLEIFGKEIQITRLMQHGSTLLGAIAIVLFLTKGGLLSRPKKDYIKRPIRHKLIFWCYCLLFSILFICAILWLYKSLYHGLPVSFLETIGLASWAGFFWAIVFLSLYKELSKRYK
ncbi:MAG: DUF4184 family protein, partial [bacterium]